MRSAKLGNKWWALIMRVNKIIIFTEERFPYGMAATNRIVSYAKGFVGNGKKTEVICLQRTENADNIRNYKRNGYFDNIKFTYLSKSTVKSRFFIMRRVHNFFSYLSLFLIV